MDRVLSWRSTVFANGQPPLKPARLRASGPFPYRAIVSARAFGFGRVWSLENECGYHERGELAPPPDDALPFASDGTLCPDVIPPSEVLSASDLEAVLNGLRAAEAEFREEHAVVLTRCAFEPHHALVFYDKRDVPVAKLVVCLTCGEVLGVPAMAALGGKDPAMLNETLAEALIQAFEHSALAPWMYDETESASVRAYRDAVHGPNRQRAPSGAKIDPQGSGLEPSRLVAQLTSKERTRLCVWFQEQALSGDYRSGDFVAPGHGYECEDGRSLSLAATPAECAAVPAQCTASVAEVEACLRDLIGIELRSLCTNPEPVACSKVRGCVPGISDKLGPR